MPNLKTSCAIHNRFDIVVKDAKTGKVKQRAKAYNVVLNGFFTWLTSYVGSLISSGTYGLYLPYGLSYGSGSGTPAVTDSGLFSSQGTLQSYDFGAVTTNAYGNPTSWKSVAFTLDVNTANGVNITEVGLVIGNGSSNTRLISHAMLQDSEGNQISINKTSNDVVIITATIYLTITNAGFGTGALYPAVQNNALVTGLMAVQSNGGTNKRTGIPSTVYMGNIIPANCEEIAALASISSDSGTPTADATGKATYPLLTISPSIGDKKSIRCIGLPGIGVAVFPNHDIFPPFAISNLAIGTGDGATTDFNIAAPYIMTGSEVITVGGAVKTKGTDYTIDYDANPYDQHECYYSAALRLGAGATFGNMGLGTVAYDPCLFGLVRTVGTAGTITQAKPIHIDFVDPKSCNRLRLEINSMTTVQQNALTVEYSTDDVNWVTAPGLTHTGQLWSWTLTNARYWCVYLSGQSWTYSAGTSASLDGVTTGASFYLGKSVPGLHFITPPASGLAVQASYNIDIPYKTSNNKLTFQWAWQIGRG